jgi:TP901 family phage tail tape measure protein
MAYDIGTARGVIEIDYDGKGVTQAQAGLEGVSKKGKKVSGDMQTAGRNAGRAGLVIGAGLAAGVVAAANFEQRMSAIKAVSGATGAEMDSLSDKALQLGADTSFSAGESASAMEELIKAGLTVEEVLNGAADATVALAAAGEVDLTTAATIASNSMNQFGIKAQDMVGVVDSIAGAANASAIDVGDFGQSLNQVGAVANLAGVSFDDTATAIALMGNAGIKGSDAGTSLKSMFMRLQPTTKKQSELMKELGIITEDGANAFFDQQGNMKSLSSVAGTLNKTLGFSRNSQKQVNKAIADGKDPLKAWADEAEKSGKKQQFMKLQTLFGSDAIRAAAIMAGEGSKGFDKMSKSIDKVSAADVAKERLNNLKGSTEALMGSLETLGIQLGSILIPIITSLVEKITGLVNWFTSLSGGQQKAIVAGLAFIATALLIIAAVVKIARAILVMRGALAAIRVAMAITWVAALGPIALVVAALVGLGIMFVILWKKSELFRNVVTGVWNAIKNAAVAVANWFKGPFVNFFTGAWEKIKAGLNNVKTFFSNAWTTIKNGVQNAWSTIKGAIEEQINNAKNVVEGALSAIKGFFSSAWENVKSKTSEAMGAMARIVGEKTADVIRWFQELPGRITGALSTLVSDLQQAGSDMIAGLISGIESMAGQAAQAAINVVKGALDGAKEFLGIGSPSKEFRKLGKWSAEGFIEGIVGSREDVVRTMENLVEKLKKAGEKKLAEMVLSHRKHLLRLAGEWQQKTRQIEKAVDDLRALKAESRDMASGIADSLNNAGDLSSIKLPVDAEGNELPQTIENIINGLTGAAQQAAAFEETISALRTAGLNEGAIQDLINAGPEAAMGTAQAILDGGVAAVNQINGLQATIAQSALRIGQAAADAMYSAGIATAQGMVKGLETELTNIENSMKKIARVIIKALKKELGIKSPSRIMADMGHMVGLGFAKGIAGAEHQVVMAAEGIAASAAAAMSNGDLRTAVAAGSTPLALSAALGPAILPAGLAPAPRTAKPTTAQQPSFDVRVFIGDKELTDQVRIVVGEVIDPMRQLSRQGAI